MKTLDELLAPMIDNKHLSYWSQDDFGGVKLCVMMFDSSKHMNKALGTKGLFGQFLGIPEGGAIVMNLEDIGAGTFAHELYHASCYFLKDMDEEEAARAVQKYTANFWNWYYQA
jgi:hypothetical protein